MVKTYSRNNILSNGIEDSETLLDNGSRLRTKERCVN